MVGLVQVTSIIMFEPLEEAMKTMENSAADPY